MNKHIFCKDYDGESISDLGKDIAECLDGEYNEEIDDIPCDEYGFQKGRFTVSITWSEK